MMSLLRDVKTNLVAIICVFNFIIFSASENFIRPKLRLHCNEESLISDATLI
jgi:hypothetical protein